MTILVTGAGGSIGSALVSRLVGMPGARVTGLARNEESLIRIPEGAHRVTGLARNEESLIRIPEGANRVLGSITERYALRRAMTGADTVFHCAAHKHVGICETNPAEARFNNIFGMMQVLSAAEDEGVKNFVLVSTDKAYQPVNVYGKTKQACEQMLLQSAIDNPKIVRLCNVLGSSGSVIPIWEKQIAAGGPVLVTSEEATRYFISMEDAVTLLIQSLTLPGIGPHVPRGIGPTRVIDLARMVIGERPIEIKITGLRPGERLHETLTDQM
jgi:FlaA1/EpsC-like NDP-sugar epimerase